MRFFLQDPKVLILQLPRYGQQKVFDKIIPQQELDITHLVFDCKYCFTFIVILSKFYNVL